MGTKPNGIKVKSNGATVAAKQARGTVKRSGATAARMARAPQRSALPHGSVQAPESMQVPEYPVIARAVENEVYFYLCLARDELGKRHASALLARTVVHQRLAELRDRLILLKYVPEGTR
ncbi:MAG TPA: hypothetical protein VH853_12690, partial [Polyangia bacterium]|nr:hypothetical protein [Polyangia bacterium]